MPGDDVRFALSLTMPFEDVTTSVLSGRIQGGRKYCSNFFYSIELKDLNQSHWSEIARILDFLGRKVALTDRRKDKLRPKSHQRAARVQAVLDVTQAVGLKHTRNGGMNQG